MATAAQDAMVLELMTMGQQSAAQLGALLRAASPASPHQELASEILRCCGRIIAALTANGCKKRKAVEHEDKAAAWSPPLMPPRKRSRGEEARSVVTSATTTGDGFIWRKYGQKDINGRNHPRLYYRCAYKHQGCTATRRVQRTQDEPPAYEIAYYGEHACRGASACADAAALPPPAVVDFGSNAWGCGTAPAASDHQLWSSSDCEVSQGGWSSSSTSSEADFEVQTMHEWHDTAAVVEMPSSTPCFASDPVTDFLDGCFDWESIINDVPFDFSALYHTDTATLEWC